MKRLLVTLALVAAVAPAAGAQVLGSANFGTLCSELPSGNLVCANASAELYTGMLRVSLQNVQGPAGDFETGGVPNRITGFGLYYAGASMGASGTLAGPVPAGGWLNGVSNDLRNPGPDGAGWTWLLGTRVQGNGGMVGCDVVGSGAASSCAGPLVFTFTNVNDQLVDMDRLEFAFRSQSIGEAPGSIKCYSSDEAGTDHSCMPLSTVPEPGTVVLLASGILGLGGFGLARRRREGKV